jgi:hypothetical protein
MEAIGVGQRVLARTSSDRMLERRATTPVVDGVSIPVVWVCPQEQLKHALRQGRPPKAITWPPKAVK